MVKLWSTGDILTSSDMNIWTVPRFAFKSASTSRASNTTLSADPHLIAAADASAHYEMVCLLDYEADATAEFKFQFTLPASASMVYSYSAYTPSDAFTFNGGNTSATVVIAGGGGAGSSRAAIILGTVTTAGTAGNVGLNWAQNASSGTATILHAESYLKLVRVG